MATPNLSSEKKPAPAAAEEVKVPAKVSKAEPAVKTEKKCYVLRVKRKKAEKPADSLILETIELPDKRKKLRVLPPEDFLQEKFNDLALEQALHKKGAPQKPMVFQRIPELDEDSKKAKEVKFDITENCELFELGAGENDTMKKDLKGKRINLMSGPKTENQKTKIIEEHEKLGKAKRSERIDQKRKEILADLHEGAFSV